MYKYVLFCYVSDSTVLLLLRTEGMKHTPDSTPN